MSCKNSNGRLVHERERERENERERGGREREGGRERGRERERKRERERAGESEYIRCLMTLVTMPDIHVIWNILSYEMKMRQNA